MRLIDRDKIFQKAMDIIQDKADLKEFAIANAIGMAEAIEAEPVKHGKWRTSNRKPLPTNTFVCSECDGLVIVSTFRNSCLYNYCPNCGAKMDGGCEDEHE